MKFSEFLLKESGNWENHFDQLTKNTPRNKRHPEKEPDKMTGTIVRNKDSLTHKSNNNYIGKGYSSSFDQSWRGVNSDPHLSLPVGGKQGGSHDTRKFRETTGDRKFDNMLGKIVGSDKPEVDQGNRKTIPDREIMEWTHKIFLRLQQYHDPDIYRKFIEFMIKTIESDIGPIDESMKKAITSSVNFDTAFDYVKQCLSNASIDLPPYNSPEFRIDQLDNAIRRLQLLKNYLTVDLTIKKASAK